MKMLSAFVNGFEYSVASIHEQGVTLRARFGGASDIFYNWPSVYSLKLDDLVFIVSGVENYDVIALATILKEMGYNELEEHDYVSSTVCSSCEGAVLRIRTKPPYNESQIGYVRAVCPGCGVIQHERDIRWMNKSYMGHIWREVVEKVKNDRHEFIEEQEDKAKGSKLFRSKEEKKKSTLSKALQLTIDVKDALKEAFWPNKAP